MMPATSQQSAVLLSELVEGCAVIAVEDDREIHAVQIDSRLLTKGDLFIAMPGVDCHALSYLESAVTAGACCVLFDKSAVVEFKRDLDKYKNDIVLLEVDSVRKVAGIIIDRFYMSPSKKMQVIGVTGTDGKTSVTQYIAQAMMPEIKTALIGTTGNGIWGDLTSSTYTTPDVLSLHKILFDMNNKGASQVVMEVSSHGIDQKRIASVDIDTAVLTNVTRDHLDYHESVENYRDVKKRLFNQDSVKNVVINLDDETGCDLAESLRSEKNVWVYSLKAVNSLYKNYVYAKEITVEKDGFSIEVVTSVGVCRLQVPLMGRFNISNALSVLSVLLLNKMQLATAADKISQLKVAAGRMEGFSVNKSPLVVVDYAHTPKALELALRAAAEHSKGRVWCVFGCGGNRDQGKRPLMGAAAEKYADFVIVTDDNPRNEESSVISQQILSGIKNKELVKIIADRKAAIEYACEQALAEDVVLVAGKGHEEFQIVGDNKIPLSDREIVKKSIGGLS